MDNLLFGFDSSRDEKYFLLFLFMMKIIFLSASE